MSLKVGDNFNYQGKKPNFARDQFSTIAAMASYPATSLDEGHICFVTATGKYYRFSNSYSEDETLGKWRILYEEEFIKTSSQPISNGIVTNKFTEVDGTLSNLGTTIEETSAEVDNLSIGEGFDIQTEGTVTDNDFLILHNSSGQLRKISYSVITNILNNLSFKAYNTVTELNSVTPVAGQIAFVGTSFPLTVYRCYNDGTWTRTSESMSSSIDLSDYYNKSSVDNIRTTLETSISSATSKAEEALAKATSADGRHVYLTEDQYDAIISDKTQPITIEVDGEEVQIQYDPDAIYMIIDDGAGVKQTKMFLSETEWEALVDKDDDIIYYIYQE